jgi:hypothetical protein
MGGFSFHRGIRSLQAHLPFHQAAAGCWCKGVRAHECCVAMHAYGSAGAAVGLFVLPVVRVVLDEPALAVTHYAALLLSSFVSFVATAGDAVATKERFLLKMGRFLLKKDKSAACPRPGSLGVFVNLTMALTHITRVLWDIHAWPSAGHALNAVSRVCHFFHCPGVRVFSSSLTVTSQGETSCWATKPSVSL